MRLRGTRDDFFQQRQKIGLGRALLKRPDYLIVNEATALLDGAAQARIMKSILKSREGKGVLWVLRHVEQAAGFHRLLVLKDGRVAEQGKPEEILARRSKAPAEVAAQ